MVGLVISTLKCSIIGSVAQVMDIQGLSVDEILIKYILKQYIVKLGIKAATANNYVIN